MDCLDEYDYCEMMNTAVQKAASKTERSHSLCHLPIDKERAGDVSYLAQVTLDIFNDPARPMDEESARRRVLLIQSWENKLHTQFDSTAGFMEKMGKVAKGKSWKPQDAQKLRRVRRKRKMTQELLADFLTVDRSLLSKMESGERELSPKVKSWLDRQ